jgi:PadR family transcriptional regulator AphA
VRDLGLLKLFFGADPSELAEVQLAAHRAELAEYERIRDGMPEDVPEGPRLALELGMRQARTWIEFWEELGDRSPG